MPAAKYATARTATRTDGIHIGKRIKEIVRLTIEEGMSWQLAADAVGLKRTEAFRALSKPHVRNHMREERKKFIEALSMKVPRKLDELMSSDNAAAAVRACLAVEELANETRAEPTRRIQTGGIVIVLGANAQRALPATTPALELQRIEDEVADG
jgi:hypothetical protein